MHTPVPPAGPDGPGPRDASDIYDPAAHDAPHEAVAALQAATHELEQLTLEIEGIFRALPDLYFRLADDGRILDRRGGQTDGFRAPEGGFVGHRLQDVVGPALSDRFETAFDAARRTGELQHLEYPLDAGADAPVHEARIVPVHTGGLIVVVRDITSRKRVEEALQEREERHRRLIENASDLISILGPEGAVRYESDAIERLLGYTQGELWGRPIWDLIHPDDVPEVRRVFRAVLEDPGSARTVTLRFLHKNGSWRTVEAIGQMLDPDNPDEGVVVNSRDVTERVESERELQAREEHFRALIEKSSDMVQLLDGDGRISYTGPSVERLLGYHPEQIAGTDPMTYIHPEDLPATSATLEQMLANPGRTYQVEYRVRHRDGHYRTFEAFARAVPGEDGAGLQVVVNARDITERKQTESALQAAKEEADAANRAKSEFLSRMSHELRTPMNSILGFGQLLARAQLPPDQQKAVGHILRAGGHLLTLINEVLDISRIEAGQQAMSLEPVRVDVVVQEAMALTRPIAVERGVVLEDPDSPTDIFVLADRQRLTQVVLNLLSNAVKYNRPEGHVRVRWGVEGGTGRGRVRLRVEDDGFGIPVDQQDRLFIPFSRLDADRSGIEGTGLGLALSQRLAEAMGGALELDRSSEAGSTLCLELDAARDPLHALEDDHPRAAAGPGPHPEATLLYIEDNLANLQLIESILAERPGWRTIPALQGSLGVELAREHLPDLVLLDLHLPDLSGDEVMRRLRADPRTAAIPILVVSADATEAAMGRLRAAGADGYLTKPLDVSEFLEAVDRLLAPAEPG